MRCNGSPWQQCYCCFLFTAVSQESLFATHKTKIAEQVFQGILERYESATMNWNRIKLIALMTIIFVPISSATWLFVRSADMAFSGNTTNKGTLISPVLDITELGLVDSDGSTLFQRFEDTVANIDPADYDPRPWMLVYLGSESCDEACVERLYFLRQLHRRLGSDE